MATRLIALVEHPVGVEGRVEETTSRRLQPPDA
jgi:hypothetical protein